MLILYRKSKVFRACLQWIGMHIPFFGKIIIYNEITLFTKTFASLLRNSVYITNSMEILINITNNEIYKEIIAPSELKVLEAANGAKGHNILHICGYEGARNNIELFKDYPAQVVNWAVGPEGISLAKGRNIFGGRTVLGGFENGKDGLLYTGTKKAIQEKVREIIADNGTQGLIIGADCTIPSDINHERIEWVREAAIL